MAFKRPDASAALEGINTSRPGYVRRSIRVFEHDKVRGRVDTHLQSP